MQKIITSALLYTLIAPAFAAPTEIHSLLPMSSQATPKVTKASHQHQRLRDNITVKAGGYGGNTRTGQISYDGAPFSLPWLSVSRSPGLNCYLDNYNAHIINYQNGDTIKFYCPTADPAHNYLYWSGELGKVNGGFSPENDTLYAADVITNMFFQWYGIPPVLDHQGRHDPIHVFLHKHIDNIYATNEAEIFAGDGGTTFYPLTSLNILSYMVGLIFTEQHTGWSSDNTIDTGIHIAFACMTSMAAEYFATGKNTWQVGAEVTRSGKALHYMDQPSKDCNGKKPGDQCSIDLIAQYKSSMPGFYSSGLFNRVFYLLANSHGWDTRKAYNVFVQANRFHWKQNMSFRGAACDVLTSTNELGYDAMSVMVAFSAVGIDIRNCYS